MIRAEDLLDEDAVQPNILRALRRDGLKLERFMRSQYSDPGMKRAPHGMRSPYWNLITVAKKGGDFQTITEALIQIEDASAINRYCIFAYPGLYDEEVVHKEYVALVGLDRDVCIIQSSDYQHLVQMANHSSLNEIQIVNLYDPTIGNNMSAIRLAYKTDVLIDSCIARAESTGTGTALALYVDDPVDVRSLGSEFLATSTAGLAHAAYIESLTYVPGDVEIKYCRLEALSDADSHYGIYAIKSGAHNLHLDVLGCFIVVSNQSFPGCGIVSWGDGCSVDALQTSIEHKFDGGGGYDLEAHANSIIYVRAVRYSTWNTATGGQIIPLAGDRPRLECTRSAIPWTVPDTWTIDPNVTRTIDLPCKSDLYCRLDCLWFNDSAEDRCIRTRFILDGAITGGSTAEYAGAANTDCRMSLGNAHCFSDVAAGSHTIQVQFIRRNAGDTPQVSQRSLQVHSVPWP